MLCSLTDNYQYVSSKEIFTKYVAMNYSSMYVSLISSFISSDDIKGKPFWERKENDEFEDFGSDEQQELNQMYEKYLAHPSPDNKKFHTVSQTIIDFQQMSQTFLSTNMKYDISRDIGTFSNYSWLLCKSNIYPQQSSSSIVTHNKKPDYNSLTIINHLQKCSNTDCISLNITSAKIRNINNTLYSSCISNDRAFASFMINTKHTSLSSYDQQINTYLQYIHQVIIHHNTHHINTNYNEILSILPLYQYNITLNTKVLSYLLNSAKINVLVYDKHFRLICVIFSNNKEYIHTYQKTKCNMSAKNEYNPWRHISIINWYSFLSDIHPDVSDIFCEPSSNCFAVYNNYIRVCIGYEYANEGIHDKNEGSVGDKLCVWSKSVFLDKVKFHSMLNLYSETLDDLNIRLPKMLLESENVSVVSDSESDVNIGSESSSLLISSSSVGSDDEYSSSDGNVSYSCVEGMYGKKKSVD